MTPDRQTPEKLARVKIDAALRGAGWIVQDRGEVSLEDSAGLPEPHELAEEIAEDLRSALQQIESVLGDLRDRQSVVPEA